MRKCVTDAGGVYYVFSLGTAATGVFSVIKKITKFQYWRKVALERSRGINVKCQLSRGSEWCGFAGTR